MSNFQAQFPHEENWLEPVLSAETVRYHYGKHHCGYAKNLDALVENTHFAGKSLEEIIVQSRGTSPKIFNNAAQLFNHDFYWKCLKTSVSCPSGAFGAAIGDQFGSFDDFMNKYTEFANTMFGSGWSWLTLKDGQLSFVNTINAETILGTGSVPVCVIDLWEHAYYIDYRNDRALYINKIIRECINWEFCDEIIAV